MNYRSSLAPRIAHLKCEDLLQPLGVEVPSPRLSWQLERVVRQSAYQIRAASDGERLAQGCLDVWDSGRVESAQSLAVPYAGPRLVSRQRVIWQVRVWDEQGQASEFSAPSWFEMGLLKASDWKAQWIGRPDISLADYKAPVLPAPLLRKAFEVPQDISQARVYLCGLGYFELRLNGARVGDHVLDPIVTHYEKRAGYVTHNVTSLLQPGENIIGVMLGNGWYNTHSREVWQFDKASWRDYPKLLLQLEITRADGSTQYVCSDSSWFVTDGPIRFDGLRDGEIYDAREDKKGWSLAGFDISAWKRVAVVAGPGGEMFSQQAPPCRVVETRAPRTWNEVRTGVWVCDFGQNLTGWARLRITAEAGTEITLRYAERLSERGEVDQKHLAQFMQEGEFQTDHFISGCSEETFEPHFTYHGFQYVQVEGLPYAPTEGTLIACVVQSDFASSGEFECSDETLNHLQNLTRWSYRGNFTGIPTDCPHREKNGWTGDAQLACETGLWNFDAAGNYAHWLQTVVDVQRPSGQLPCIVPTGGWGYNWGNGPAWDSALILIPWQMYRFRGDTGILQKHYNAMKLYVDFASSLADGGLIRYGLGDWNAPDMSHTAPRDLVTTAILFDDCRILSRVARLLHHEIDAMRFDEMAAALRIAWRRAFCHSDGIAENEQTSLGCALYYDLLESSERLGTVELLRKALAAANGRPTFGILGAKWVPRALSQTGYAEEAFALITGKGCPGWAHWLEQGATTLWGNWHGEGSRNHIMFGDISAWMFEYLGGIRPREETPGFEAFTLAPAFIDSLTQVTAQHCSPYGLIRSTWQHSSTSVEWEIMVPANSKAILQLPDNYRFADTTTPLLTEGNYRLRCMRVYTRNSGLNR